MLTKTMTAFSALLIFGSASTAFANEVPESNISDRYPFLEQNIKQDAPAAITEFSAVKRRGTRVNAAGKAWLDHTTAHVSDY